MRRWLRNAIIAGSLLASGCPEPEVESQPEAVKTVPTPEILIAGCVEAPTTFCTVDPREASLTVWLDAHAATPIEVQLDGKTVSTVSSAVDGGLQLQLPIPRDTELLRLQGVQPLWADPFELRIEWLPRPAWLASAIGLTASGKLDKAARQLEANIDGAEGHTKLEALDSLRRVEYDRGQPERAAALTERSLKLAIEIGARRVEAQLLSARANGQIVRLANLQDAAKTVQRLFVLGETDRFALSRAHNWAGELDRKSGSLDSALQHFTKAQRIAERRGDLKFLGDVVESKSVILGELGRADEALELGKLAFSLVRDIRVDLCDRLEVARNYAWTQLVLEASGHPYEPPRPYLLEVLELCEDCPESDWERANAMLSLGLAELADGRPDDALGWLAQIDTVPPDLDPWIEEVAARASADSIDPAQEPSLLRNPTRAADTQLRWNALVRHAQAARRWGFDDVALADYAEAEALLDQQLGKVGITSGAELFLAGRSASAKALVELRLERNETAEALCAARLARGRVLAQLDRVARLSAAGDDARTRWNAALFEVLDERAKLERARRGMWRLSEAERKSRTVADANARADLDAKLDRAVRGLGLSARAFECDDLRAQAEGEVVLYLVPLQTDWVVFASSSTRLVSTRVDEEALLDPSSPWLAELEDIGGASRVVVVPTGAAWNFRVHQASFHGKPLIASVPVVYSLDLPVRAQRAAPETAALVVGDPSENLPLARKEAMAAADALAAASWSTTTLVGSAATRGGVEAAIANASLLHYAGHGVREGVSGWDSALLLSGGAQLGVRDVMAFPSVPSGVVLTGCNTASTSPNTLDGGMNLARAFVLAGSDWVIAADRDVADTLASSMGAALYRSTNDQPDWIRAAQQAQLEVRSKTREANWAAFRVIVP